MSRSTSRRRAAGIGVGALAAVVLAAPSALAATATLVVDPPSDDLFAVVTALPAALLDGEEVTGALPVPEDGAVTVALAPGLAVPGAVEAVLLDPDEYERTLVDEEESLPEPLPVVVTATAAGPEDEVVLDLVVDTAAAAELEVDEAYVAVDGVQYSAFAQDTPVVLAVDLVPAATESPAEAATAVTVVAPLDDVVTTEPGGRISVELPVESAVRATGVTDLEGLSAFLVSGGDEPVEDAEDLASAATGALSDLSASDVSSAAAAEPEVDLPSVEVDGRTAVLTLSDEQPVGSSTLILARPLPGGGFSSLVVVAEALVELPVEPEPTPAPPETAAPVPVPGPTATVTAPPRRNPGLRSNTGVETAPVPGLSDAQLVAAGAGLLLLGSGAAVMAVRRRAADA